MAIQSGKKSSAKGIILLVAKIAVSGGIVGFLVFKKILPNDEELRSIHEALTSLSLATVLPWLAGAFAVQATGMLFTITRWRFLLRGQGMRIGWWHALGSFLIGRFIGSISPGTTGLDGWRMYDVARQSKAVARSVSVIAVEKVIGFFVLSLLLLSTLPLGSIFFEANPAAQASYMKYLKLYMLAAGIPLTACVAVLLKPGWIGSLARRMLPPGSRISGPVTRIVESVTTYEQHRRELLLGVVCGFPVHVATTFLYFFTARALGVPVTLTDILFVAPIMIAATVVPASIAGIGVREGVFVAFLGPVYGTGIVALFAFLGYLVGQAISLLGGPVWLARRADYNMFKEMQARGDSADGKQAGPGPAELVESIRQEPDARLERAA